jgi:hypothetical protein
MSATGCQKNIKIAENLFFRKRFSDFPKYSLSLIGLRPANKFSDKQSFIEKSIGCLSKLPKDSI